MHKHWEDFLKRAFDIVCALTAIVVVSPVMLVAAALVRFSSRGPVIYRGVRTGRHGTRFHILKFRSMVVDAERLGGTTTGKNDPRVTPVGHFLRKYKLDELPQFFNVLRGDMSIVGPRPEVAEYTDEYSPDEQRILTVRPGITDLATLEFRDLQEVLGPTDPDATFRENVLPRKNELRLKYVDERSFWGDVVIVMRTVCAVMTKPFRSAV